ncbi:uncharacterized protein BP5553_00203 [Venustampulla echinocandica]|uniref:Rhodopsin domain-containing protein n=1 Tax=Venustampulla echinocandica TaxID=2656787 RepID=A0A370TXF9_9HELO|nr:uncharacterized protein BP5553_00203 [Venustampulla echinocandica]RDL40224.1 hypothetical protein BP5553_00203 [Venustampulla echinocandica]
MTGSFHIPPDSNASRMYLVPCGLLLALATGLCTTRIYTRFRPTSHLKQDDYLIGMALILSIASYFICAAAASYGWGHPMFRISLKNQTIVLKCMYASYIIWAVAVAFVRISVAFSLLRLNINKPWRGVLWTLIAIQVLIAMADIIILLFNCTPVRANWEFVYYAHCWDPKKTNVFGFTSAGESSSPHFYPTKYPKDLLNIPICTVILILMDLTFAIMPIKLIWTLNRPFRERLLIGVLMAMGILTTAIRCARMTTYKSMHTGDILTNSVRISLWAQLEGLVGIITACLPCLKGPAERALRRAGVLSSGFHLSKPSFVISKRERNPPGELEAQRSREEGEEGDEESIQEWPAEPGSHASTQSAGTKTTVNEAMNLSECSDKV